MWSTFSACTCAIKILRNEYPVRLKEELQKLRFPFRGKIYDTSKGKIGKYKFVKSLGELDNLEWNLTWRDDGLCIFLKDKLNFDFLTFFILTYFLTNWTIEHIIYLSAFVTEERLRMGNQKPL